ncbi:hypothetical protein [Peribacillus sp. SCS-155]|uniref:hypothetical protein n=1 Tax=Peribacillus sedimenti TaxID=3115297 RepID=UPI003905AFC1
MKSKEFVLSIILNLFLGYLWLLFFDHIIAKSNNNSFIIGACFMVIGMVLFGEIVKRITPFNKYKLTC